MKDEDWVNTAYGVSMPKVIYGTAWKGDRTAGWVELAVTLGFRGIDTACQPKHYYEPGVGEGIAACLTGGLTRADLYLQSKFTPANGQDPKRMPYDPKSSLANQVAQSFETSLENLRTDYLDSLVLHSPLADEEELLEVWRAMEMIFDTGRTWQIGISNCYRLEQLEWLFGKARIKPAVVQNRFYADTQYDREIRDFCRQHQIIYQSFWTLTANAKVLAHDVVQTLAATYRRTPAQIFFRYLTQNDIVCLTGTTSETHMREDLAVFGFELTATECVALGRLL